MALRFNFRGVGRSEGVHANLEGEIEDARAALDWLRGRYPGLPFALAGFSFGARVVTRLACTVEAPEFVLAAGFPTRMGDTAYLETCAAPRIFVQSTHDEFGPREQLEALVEGLPGPKHALGGSFGPLLRRRPGAVGGSGVGRGGVVLG